ncbi:hypothetical protein J437_LFUL004850 [Ladona fulva]|uniref:Transposase domain-containing protein n=1 Tax=Ladona fulva TaxID=123851 RepID=A0A8K0NZ12_LADFU|nr:hypothetical protein J437_LFUL004850 [Ladona fulva]
MLDAISHDISLWAPEKISVLSPKDHHLQELIILKSHDCFSSLPADSRTLLKTPRSTNIKDIGGGGKYCHFGIRVKVTQIINLYPIVREHQLIKLQTNVDGLPLSKSSRSNLWLIVIALEDHDFIPPFVAGVFHGTSKPENVEMYMADYVQEISKLIEDGIECLGRNYKICVTSYICDAPARAFLAQIKGHTGYFSCSKCKIKGIHTSNGVVFDKFESPLRTHEDFVNMTDEQHHLPNKTSPLIVIPGINMVDRFPFEYMHLVCLGVMRKILYSFMKGSNYKVCLTATILDQLSVKIVNLCPYIPSEFGRKPRSLQELLRWKATEFRKIFLYTSPLVFPKFLSCDVYNHFISLHYAIRILSSRLYASQQLQYARSLLKYFVSNFHLVYSLRSLSYNVHGLLHLADDVQLHGPLDNFSAFKFENKLQQLKKLIRKHDKPLQQIARRIFEKEMAMKVQEVCNYPVLKKANGINSTLPLGLENPIYNSVEFKDFKITQKRPNNCVVMKNGDICVVQLIANKFGKPHFLGHKFKDVSDFYSKPGSSQVIGTHCAKGLSQAQLLPVSGIKNKALMIPLDPHNGEESFYIAEMLHISL